MTTLSEQILNKTRAVPLLRNPSEALTGTHPSAVCGTSSHDPSAASHPSGSLPVAEIEITPTAPTAPAAECGIASHASQTIPETGSELALAFLQNLR